MNLEANAKLRSKTINRRIFTNIKAFSSSSEQHYRAQIEENTQLRGFFLSLSVEAKEEYRHDLVGLLNLLSKFHSEIFKGDELILVILDGGMKSRNYLLTLYFGYQGLYRVLDRTAWDLSVEASAALAKQLPNKGTGWAMVCASDYDLLPSQVSVGDQPLEHLASDASFVFFGRGGHDVELASDLKRLSSKGIMLVGTDGRLLHFEEKPSVERLHTLIQMQGCALVENVMYVAIRKSALFDLFASFDAPESVAYPGRKLREAIPFGFFSTLAASPLMDADLWMTQWAHTCPPKPQSWTDKCEWEEAFCADGIALRSIATAFMKTRTVYCASLGASARVGDMGEPLFYLDAVGDRAFTAIGRQLACIPDGTFVDTTVDPMLTLTIVGGDERTVLLHRCHFDGSGTVRIAGDRVIMSNCRVHVPAGEMLEIGTGTGTGTWLLESCRIVGGGQVRGSRGIILGYDSKERLESDDAEIVVCLSMESRRSVERFSLLRSASDRDPVSGRRVLDECVIQGRDFFDAMGKIQRGLS